MSATHTEGPRTLPVTRDVDVIVVGGGTAGLAAAICSARNGARTVLVERFPYLGGTATASLMACINGFRNQVEPDARQVIRGIAEEIVLELKRQGGLHGSHYQQKRYPTRARQDGVQLQHRHGALQARDPEDGGGGGSRPSFSHLVLPAHRRQWRRSRA